MRVRAVAWFAIRVVAVLAAVALLLATPVVVDGPTGRSYEPLGIVIDAVALVVLAAVAWTVLSRRPQNAR